MIDLYSVKYVNGELSFEVQGADKVWVDTKLELFKTLISTNIRDLPGTIIGQAPKHNTTQGLNQKPPHTSVVDYQEEINKVASVTSMSEQLLSQLVDYVADRKTEFDLGASKQAAIVAVFLKDNLGIEFITKDDLEFIYRKLGWNTISHSNQLRNAKNRNKFFTSNDGDYTLTYAGTRFGRDESNIPL